MEHYLASTSTMNSSSLKRRSKKEISTHSSTALSSRSYKRKRSIKAYDPIKLPEDILTIQAQRGSTPVTELPYLLIAAHLGALPPSQVLRHATSQSESPLTVFRDMFVMAVDVSAYEAESVQIATTGRLVTIECVQVAHPQVVFTQTGVVNDKGKYIIDSSPILDTMPTHSSFNYAQHRIQLPENFSEEGLQVGYDDVSRYVIITGRIVHEELRDFPETWNMNKKPRKIKKPLVNTLWDGGKLLEDAQKLASNTSSMSTRPAGIDAVNPILTYGKKSWLELEGAKLRAIQRKALRDHVRNLKELENRKTLPPRTNSENTNDPTTSIDGGHQQQSSKVDSSQYQANKLSSSRRGSFNARPATAQQLKQHPNTVAQSSGVGGRKQNSKSNYNHVQGARNIKNSTLRTDMHKENSKSGDLRSPAKSKSSEDHLEKTRANGNDMNPTNNSKQKRLAGMVVNSEKGGKVSNSIRVHDKSHAYSVPPSAVSPLDVPELSERSLASQSALPSVNTIYINNDNRKRKTRQSISEPMILAALKEFSNEDPGLEIPEPIESEHKKTKKRKRRKVLRNIVSCYDLSVAEDGEQRPKKSLKEMVEDELETPKELWINLLHLAGRTK